MVKPLIRGFALAGLALAVSGCLLEENQSSGLASSDVNAEQSGGAASDESSGSAIGSAVGSSPSDSASASSDAGGSAETTTTSSDAGSSAGDSGTVSADAPDSSDASGSADTATASSDAGGSASDSGHETGGGESIAQVSTESQNSLSAPDDVKVVLQADNAIVSWSIAEGADAYRVYWAVGGTPDANSTSQDVYQSSYTYTGLQAGDALSFKVSSVSGERESALSRAVTVVKPSEPESTGSTSAGSDSGA